MREDIQPIIDEIGVSPLEFYLLNAVRLRGPHLEKDYLATFVRWLDIDEDFTVPEYEEGIQTCLSKNWIKRLTPDDCEEDRRRWSDVRNRCFTDFYEEDNFDFTP